VINDPLEIRCVICGGWVDKSLPYRDPATGRVNPGSPSLEHTVALIDGGGLLQNGALAHLGCNRKAGAHMSGRAKQAAALREPSRHF
jgi:hypothetical protein